MEEKEKKYGKSKKEDGYPIGWEKRGKKESQFGVGHGKKRQCRGEKKISSISIFRD
jgi:CRISPR/Cas system CMR-associated protein Cmr3 (group 5 of RAMP superfamily)